MRGRDTSGLSAADATNAAIDTAQQVCHGRFSQCGHVQQVMPVRQRREHSPPVWSLLMLAKSEVIAVPVIISPVSVHPAAGLAIA